MLNGQFVGVHEKSNTFVLQKQFALQDFSSAKLKITALGLYFANINGKRVGNDFLCPGWTSYNKTLQMQEYDVTSLLRDGQNQISLTVNQGWYCGRLTWNSLTNTYGTQSAVCAELIVDGKSFLYTDESWLATESVIRNSSIYDGETVNYLLPCNTLTPIVVPFEKSAIVCQISQPVRTTEQVFAKDVFVQSDGIVYDFGQNLVGVAQLNLPPDFQGTVTLQFAEILVDGKFYTDNLRSAKATDVFVVKGQRQISPEFTYHGFRYLKVAGANLSKQDVVALVRHTDMPRTGIIQTDNARVQRLYENVLWSQRGNFVDIPTDCPQRDERLGWTGDINAFCATAAYNYDIRAIIKKWLKTVRDDQLAAGEIPFVVPDCLKDSGTDAMWCDVITMVPWTMYQMYGDKTFLSDNYTAMKLFIQAREKTMVDGLVAKGHEFGDWLALDIDQVMDTPVGRTDVYFLTNVFQIQSLRIVAKTAEILGFADQALLYKQKCDSLLQKVQKEYFTETGKLAVDTITAHAVALHFAIVPQQFVQRVARDLNTNVVKHRYCMTTGFIGSPFLLFALADNGYMETAGKVLLNSAHPGWLYEVDMGATTIWERWNSLLPDGTPNPNGMNSYNHYAYGSVVEFFYRRIAGIESIDAGFSRVRIAPNPLKGLPCFSAEYDSVCGKIVSKYAQTEGQITFTIQIPDGITAEICLPNQTPFVVYGGKHVCVCEFPDLNCAPFAQDSLVAEVLDSPKAYKAFKQVFGGAIDNIPFVKHDLVTLQTMANIVGIDQSDFINKLQQANDIFGKLTKQS